MEEKVVKCKSYQCEQYFMLTEKVTKCPFCHAEYDEDEKEIKKLKERKVPVKSQK